MKKNIFLKTIIIFFMMLITILLMSNNSNAANLTITPSKKTVSPGETFTVTVTLSNGAGYITSGGKTEWLDKSSFSYTVTAGESGSINLSASGVAGDYTTEKDENLSAQSKVEIIASTGNNSGGNSGGTTNTNTNTTPTLSNLGIRPNDFKRI